MKLSDERMKEMIHESIKEALIKEGFFDTAKKAASDAYDATADFASDAYDATADFVGKGLDMADKVAAKLLLTLPTEYLRYMQFGEKLAYRMLVIFLGQNKSKFTEKDLSIMERQALRIFLTWVFDPANKKYSKYANKNVRYLTYDTYRKYESILPSEAGAKVAALALVGNYTANFQMTFGRIRVERNNKIFQLGPEKYDFSKQSGTGTKKFNPDNEPDLALIMELIKGVLTKKGIAYTPGRLYKNLRKTLGDLQNRLQPINIDIKLKETLGEKLYKKTKK